MYEILPYSPELDQRFDHFVNHESVNGTFLQTRRFLNYHPAGRFTDASFALQKSGIIAVYFPGTKTEKNEFISHQGSTFGGPIVSKAFYNGTKLRELLEEASQHLSQYSKVILKITPAIFSKENPDLLEYTLEHLGYSRHTELSNYTPLYKGTDPLSQCDAKHRKQFQESENFAYTYRELESDQDFETFYHFLELSKAKHQTKPVHTLADLHDLRRRLKKKLRFKSLWLGERYICGMMQFLFPETGTIHDQYISPDETFTDFHPTTAMHIHALREAVQEGFSKFSWGISTENGGNYLNENLYRFKEAFGAQPSVNVTYEKQL